MPDRGDRPELTEFVISRLPRDIQFLHINYPPIRKQFDLTARIKAGVDLARSRNFKRVFIAENDDFYPKDHFKPFTQDFVGYEESIYYHLGNRTWEKFFHPGRASLFNTAFAVSAVENFRWPSDNTVFIDLELWHHARMRRKSIELRLNPPCIGIKHGLGLCGGKGHKQRFKNLDFHLEWLSNNMDKEAFEFYYKLSLKLG